MVMEIEILWLIWKDLEEKNKKILVSANPSANPISIFLHLPILHVVNISFTAIDIYCLKFILDN